MVYDIYFLACAALTWHFSVMHIRGAQLSLKLVSGKRN